MSKIVTLVLLQAKSLFKERSTYLFGVMAAAIIVLSLGLSGTEIGAQHKLFEDVLLTSQGYFFILAALFYAFTQRSRERNLGLFVLPIANGLKRSEYLIVQMLTLVWIILVLFLLFVLLDLIALIVVEGTVYLLLIWQLFLYALSGMMVAFLVVGFSQYVSLTNALLYSVVLFFVGHALDELYSYASYISDAQISVEWASFLYYVLPNFSLFDQQGGIVNRQTINQWSGIILPLLYFVVWSLILYLVALVRFRNKALTIGN